MKFWPSRSRKSRIRELEEKLRDTQQVAAAWQDIARENIPRFGRATDERDKLRDKLTAAEKTILRYEQIIAEARASLAKVAKA